MQPHKKPTFSKRTDDAWRDWSYTKEQIDQQLKKYYQACTTEELPPRLLALVTNLDEEITKLDEESEPSAEHVEVRR
jgi:hypothetical protein